MFLVVVVNNYEVTPCIKRDRKGAAKADSVDDAVSSLSSGLHDHMAYCLVAEPIQTHDIICLLP